MSWMRICSSFPADIIRRFSLSNLMENILLKCVAPNTVGKRLVSLKSVSDIFHINTRLSSPPDNQMIVVKLNMRLNSNLKRAEVHRRKNPVHWHSLSGLFHFERIVSTKSWNIFENISIDYNSNDLISEFHHVNDELNSEDFLIDRTFSI